MTIEITVILRSLFCFHIFITVTVQSTCEQGVNCHLPDCFCSTLTHPMDRRDIPQMVYFGFDDAVNPESIEHYDFLFRRNRTNPNGCPIGATLYISHQNTYYDIVKRYYERGFELGVHSVSHTNIDTAKKVMQEARDQRDNIAKLAGVPTEEVVGWRSPNLFTAGDGQVTSLQSLGYTYDISLSNPFDFVNVRNLWPFTLDFGCKFSNACPKQNHKGFWEIPVNYLLWKNKYNCVYTDGCYKRPNNTDEAFNFIIDNFKRHYHGNRAPFGLSLHMAWFFHPYTRAGMDRAIQEMLRYNDVYIITAKQVLQWMRQPTKISDIKHFKEWSCDKKVGIPNEIISEGMTLMVGGITVAAFIACLTVIMVLWVISKKGKSYTPLHQNLDVNEYRDCTV